MSHDARAWSVLVAGGGPAGAVLALLLRRRGHAVLLVEASRYDGFRPGETLAPHGRSLLSNIGLGERFSASAPLPAHAILSAWGQVGIEERHFLFNPYGSGWSLDRRRFDAMLAAAAEDEGAVVARQTRVTQVAAHGDGFRVTLDREGERTEESTRFVVDATGRGALIACALGARRVAHDRLIGIARVLERAGPPAGDPGDVLVLEAAPCGWWYSMPLPGGALLAVFMTDGDILARSGLDPAGLWERELSRTSHTRARAGASPAGEVHVTKAATSCLDRAAGAGWAAVGDAACAYDPLSAQGISKAVGAAISADVAVDAHLAGDSGPLERYSREVLSAFAGYRETRTRYYGAETRFPEELFWRRRRAPPVEAAPIWLDPRVLLGADTGLAPAVVLERTAALEALLPPSEVARLVATCSQVAPAHAIARAFREGAPAPWSDREILVGLQGLITAGVVRRQGG